MERPTKYLILTASDTKTSTSITNAGIFEMGQDQVSGGVSVLCWLAAPVAMFYGHLQTKFGNKVKIGIKVQFGNKFAKRCNV